MQVRARWERGQAHREDYGGITVDGRGAQLHVFGAVAEQNGDTDVEIKNRVCATSSSSWHHQCLDIGDGGAQTDYSATTFLQWALFWTESSRRSSQQPCQIFDLIQPRLTRPRLLISSTVHCTATPWICCWVWCCWVWRRVPTKYGSIPLLFAGPVVGGLSCLCWCAIHIHLAYATSMRYSRFT